MTKAHHPLPPQSERKMEEKEGVLEEKERKMEEKERVLEEREGPPTYREVYAPAL